MPPEPFPPVLVEIDHLSKSYRRGSQIIPVLDNICLTIRAGEFLALMGPSGSGKTTLLNLIAGIDQPDAGVLRIGGVDLAKLNESQLAVWRHRHLGFIFQFYNLVPVLTALENVELPLMLSDLPRSERRRHAALALHLVGLTDRQDHYPRQLSGGQQQRVAIARAIVTDPVIIAADEPTGDLDKVSAQEVLKLMTRLNQEMGKTIIMVTHDPTAAERATRLQHLDKGVLTASAV
jgi:putative ABC transport system ATP-binding protein